MKSQPQSARSSHRKTLSSITRIAAFVALVALIGIPLFSSSLASSSGPIAKSPELNSAQLEQSYKAYTTKQILRSGSGMLNILPMLMPQAQPTESIATYESDCTTASSNFETGDT